MANSLHLRGEINLLPPEAKARLRRRRTNHRLLAGALILLAAQIAGLAILGAWEATAVESAQLMRERATSLEANLTAFADLREAAVLIADRTAVYQALEPTLLDWRVILADLAAATPAAIILDTIQTTAAAGVIQIALSGTAGARADVIAFRQALDATGSFTDATFTTSELVDPASGRVNFSLTATLEATAKTSPTSTPSS